jgi:pimeloyl-CoA synthetase
VENLVDLAVVLQKINRQVQEHLDKEILVELDFLLVEVEEVEEQIQVLLMELVLADLQRTVVLEDSVYKFHQHSKIPHHNLLHQQEVVV